MNKILIVEDEKNIRESIQTILSENYETKAVDNAEDAIKLFADENFDLLISDIRLPGIDGIELVKKFKEAYPASSVIVITAFSNVKNAVEAMKAGANEYIPKPFSLDELLIKVENLLKIQQLSNEREYYQQEREHYFGEIVGESPEIIEVKEKIKKIAGKDVTVLITGETGTGKELVAYSIYRQGKKHGLFVPVHCAAYSRGVIESELFGHEKGAFTGADRQRKGKIEIAKDGILFLDEVGDIPLDIQVKLLRVIENKTFERVGGNKVIYTNAQIICATNRNLEQMVKKGEFREDLYYRINVFPIYIPPLRQRKKDIRLLADYFSKKLGNFKISEKNYKLLESYNWPGNVRELQNVIERAAILSETEDLRIDLAIGNVIIQKSISETKEIQDLDVPSVNNIGLEALLEQIEKKLILEALKNNDFNQTTTAKYLKINRSTLQYKMQKFGIDDKSMG